LKEVILNSGWDTALVAIPLVGFLFIAYFRLDSLLTRRKTPSTSQPEHVAGPHLQETGLDKDGRPLMTDPDGRRWPSSTPHKFPKKR